MTFVLGLILGSFILATVIRWSPEAQFRQELALYQMTEVKNLTEKCREGKLGRDGAKFLIRIFKKFPAKRFGVEGFCSEKKLSEAIVFNGTF